MDLFHKLAGGDGAKGDSARCGDMELPAEFTGERCTMAKGPDLAVGDTSTIPLAGFFCENDLKIEVTITDAEIDRKVKLQIQPCGIMN